MSVTRSALAPALCTLVLATLAGGCLRADVPEDFCWTRSDCLPGRACVENTCVRLPCDDACGVDEICLNDACVAALGAPCEGAPEVCPESFTCLAGTCRQLCSDEQDCPSSQPSCNPDLGDHAFLGICAQCTIGADCSDPDRPLCHTEEGICIGCLNDASCRQGGVASGMFCNPVSRVCEPGCFTEGDCPIGERCEGANGTTPGLCVECRPATENIDCPSGARPRCDPDTLRCVRCLAHDDCEGQQCALTTKSCVECVENEFCPPGYICGSQFACQPGCAGGNGGPNCPPDTYCDSQRGDRGVCVQCLQDGHCDRGEVCVDGSCVEGCKAGGTGEADAQRCLAGEDSTPLEAHCDGSRGDYGRCVQCMGDQHCPSTQRCDLPTGYCRCKTLAEPCATTSECGFDGYDEDGFPACFAFRPNCINRVRCRDVMMGTSEYRVVHLSTPECSVAGTGFPGEQGECPPGFKNARAWEVGASSDTTPPVQCVRDSLYCDR